MILGIQTTDPSPRPTFDFTAKLFSNMKLNWDGPHMPLLTPMLVVLAGGDAVGAVANVAAGPGPSFAPQVPPVRDHSPVREHSPMREHSHVRDPSPPREPTPVREPSPRPKPKPTPVSPSPPSLPPSSVAVGPTTSNRPPSPSRHPFSPEDIHEGGGDFASSPPVKTLETKLGITKKVLGDAVLKLVTRVKRLEGLLQQRKRRLVLSDSEGEDATTTEQDFDLAALHTLASVTLGHDPSATAAGPDVETTMPVERTSTTRRRIKKLFTSSVYAHVSETIPPGVRVPAAATTIPAASSVDAVVRAATAPSPSIPTAADKAWRGVSEEDSGRAGSRVCQTADWLDLLVKIATISALSKQLLGDDVMEENINERLGSCWCSCCSLIPADVSLPAATSSDPTDIPVPAISIAHAAISIPAEPVVHPAKSHMNDPLTAPAHGSSEPTLATPSPSSLRHCRKHIAKKRVTPIVDVADAAMIKFDSDSDSDDDPLPYTPYAGWEMVSSPLGSVHAYHNMAGHTKHFTTFCEILHMVERTDLQRLLGAVDALYQSEESNTFAILLCEDLHVLFQSLDDTDTLHFWRTQDSWRIRCWRLYPRAQVHVLEMVDGRVIHMFVDVSYPLSVGTLERILKHRLEVSKLLVGGDLTIAEQLIGFIKAALLNAKSAGWFSLSMFLFGLTNG
nr:hypothetical protein [Tanacetum cinerariifolium]